MREPAPGRVVAARHLAQMMMIQAMRQLLAECPGGRVGWLFALADPKMRLAINAMHQKPAYRWTLQALAERAGMSRSSFALKFKLTVGVSPMDYLARWRMLLAGERMTHSRDSPSLIRPLAVTNPKAPSVAHSSVSWDLRRGCIAVNANALLPANALDVLRVPMTAAPS